MNELLVKGLEILGLAFWIEIKTDNPKCIYYFGPFANKQEALLAQDGYVEDLMQEGTKGISLRISRFKPTELTIFDELEELEKGEDFSRMVAVSN